MNYFKLCLTTAASFIAIPAVYGGLSDVNVADLAKDPVIVALRKVEAIYIEREEETIVRIQEKLRREGREGTRFRTPLERFRLLMADPIEYFETQPDGAAFTNLKYYLYPERYSFEWNDSTLLSPPPRMIGIPVPDYYLFPDIALGMRESYLQKWTEASVTVRVRSMEIFEIFLMEVMNMTGAFATLSKVDGADNMYREFTEILNLDDLTTEEYERALALRRLAVSLQMSAIEEVGPLAAVEYLRRWEIVFQGYDEVELRELFRKGVDSQEFKDLSNKVLVLCKAFPATMVALTHQDVCEQVYVDENAYRFVFRVYWDTNSFVQKHDANSIEYDNED